MRAVVDAKEFSKALDKVSKAVRKSKFVPILEEVLVRFANGRCVLMGTDLETWLTTEIPAQGDDLAFVFRRTASVVKACRHFDGELAIELTETGEGRKRQLRLCMSCGDRVGEFHAFFPEEYPEMPILEPECSFQANASRLMERIDQIKYATLKPSADTNVCSTSIQFKGSRIYCLDGLRAAWSTDESLSVPKPFMAPAASLEYLKVFTKQDISVQLGSRYVDITDEVTHQTGLRRFSLMSNTYRPVYDVLRDLAGKLPVEGKANAAVIGRLMNNVKMGYYPTDPDNISLILRGIRFPEGVTTNLLDPCCGCGKALRQLAQGNNCYDYGMELDESRAEEAQTRLHRVGFGSFFYSRISHEAFHLLFLNPPYLSVLNESGGRARHEKKFLIESLCHLMYGGLLIYVIPYYRLTQDICRVLCDNFEDLTLWRFTDREFRKFKQIAVLGIRKRRTMEPADTLWLEQYTSDPTAIPSLAELPEDRYALPAQPLEVPVFKGEKFNQKELEQQLRRSGSFSQMMARSELDNGVKRPLLPLSIGQIGLIGGSGMINGLIECDSPHVIKGRIVKVASTDIENQYTASGKRCGTIERQVISNKMIFNVLTPQGFRALT